MAEDSRETRIGLSAAARKRRRDVGEGAWLKGYQARSGASALTASSSVLHGWDDKGNAVPFTLNVLNLRSCHVEVRRPDSEGDNATP
jgi:hypothetical protein